jgi:hypothetical protein
MPGPIRLSALAIPPSQHNTDQPCLLGAPPFSRFTGIFAADPIYGKDDHASSCGCFFYLKFPIRPYLHLFLSSNLVGRLV